MASETGAKSPIEFAISKEQREKISDLLTEMSKMSDPEKWYMHMKLPPCPIIEERIESPSPSTSAANRTSTILKWIQSHYVEDRRMCVPKQDVYNHYRLCFDSNGFNPLAMSDFGKIVKTAFPNIHDRRLGQRGKSKYYYGGLRRKPSTDELEDSEATKIEDQPPIDPAEELESLSSQLVCEWANYLLGKTFPSIKSLAQYLVCSGASCGQKAALFNMLQDSWGSSSTLSDKKSTASQLQDTQALIQRKLLQREVLKEHKNLLKQQQETNQRDAQVAAQSTVTRLTVLSPNIQISDSTDTSKHQPSTLHVLNITSKPVTPISNFPLGQESSVMASVPTHNSGSVLSEGCFSTKMSKKPVETCHKLNESLVIKTPIHPSVAAGPQKDRTIIKTKQSKLVSSKSMEDSNQRQPKRNSDFLHNTNQGTDHKRRRCITSLGMTAFEGQSSESVEEGDEDDKEAMRMRPISCPAFYDNVQTFECDMESENCQILQTVQVPSKGSDSDSMSIEEVKNVTSVTTTPTHVESDKMLKSANASSSFHFVRKPTVISIKPADKIENDEPVYANVNNLCNSNSTHASPVKKSYRILNSILSSSDSSIPQIICSPEKKVSSLGQSLLQSTPALSGNQTTDSKSEIKDNDKSLRKEAHTLDNAYLLPCQSSRSAFVRVLNGKGHADGRHEITPRPRLSSFDDTLFHSHAKQNGHSLSEVCLVSESKKTKGIVSPSISFKSPLEETEQAKQSGIQIQTSRGYADNFKPISVSVSCERVPSTTVESSKILTGTSTSVSSAELVLTSSKWNTSDPVQSGLPQAPCDSSPVTCQSKGLITKSPVTLPKRQSRSRFTPIRPKIGGCCNLSPQKKDMRPVATILKEQRARSAQELLVNLASSYQGGIKVKLPAELLGLSSPDKTKSSDVVVNIGNSTKPDPSVHNQSGKDITVILEPLSRSNPITTQASPLISPHKFIFSPDVTTTPSMSSRVPTVLNGPTVSEANVIPTYSEMSSSSTVLTSLTRPVQPLDSHLIVADAKGTIYNLESEASTALPKSPRDHHLLHTNTDQLLPSGIPQRPNVINVSDIKGHVIGPDALGQTYLLVPNSEPATLPLSIAGTASANTTVVSSPSKQTHSIMSRLTPNLAISSSSALLSELSHLASVSKQDKHLIKHDSALSAFQKCEPNKASFVAINSDKNLQRTCKKVDSNNSTSHLKDVIKSQIEAVLLKQERKGDSSKHHPPSSASLNVINDEYNDSQEMGEICVRKRKASKSRDERLNEKKRQNTKSREDDDVVIVDSENKIPLPFNAEGQIEGDKLSSLTHEEKIPISEIGCENAVPKSGDKVELCDTGALIDLVSDSRSMTVKQTVMAMNSLRAQMKKPQVPAPSIKPSTDDLLLRGSSLENKRFENISDQAKDTLSKDSQSGDRTRSIVGHLAGVSEKATQRTAHAIRRNASLNLESLESDALLDTELLLDHHLVEDVKHCKNGRSAHKTSVAVAAKTSRSVSADRLKKQSEKASSNDLNCPTPISPKALHSYHMILNDKNRSRRDKKIKDMSDKTKAALVERESNECGDKQGRSIASGDQKSLLTQGRCAPSVQDILERGSRPLVVSCGSWSKKSQQELNTLEVNAFDALLSRMHSKHFSDSGIARSHSSLLQDSEIPVDIVDFVTESMSSRKDFPQRNSSFQSAGRKGGCVDALKGQHSKPSATFGARSISVPNTKPDFFDVGQVSNNSSSSVKSNMSPFGMESQLSLQPLPGDSIIAAGESGTSVTKNVFLSPVGPAKLARRSSVEKSITQSQVDRSMTRTPIDISALNPGTPLMPLKEKLAVDACGGHKIQINEQDRTRTPVDRILMSNEKHRGHTPIMTQQHVEKGHSRREEHISQRSPVNRSLTKTPIEKFFIKQSSDPLPPRPDLFSHQSTVLREDASSVQMFISDGGYNGGSVSQTPSSDFSQGSVSQTPISDFGYNSVSPSPVMMSSSSYFGECGRNISPATIFMPLRSDSALSLNNNPPRSESPAYSNQANLLDNLPGLVNRLQNDPVMDTNSSSDALRQTEKNGRKDSLPEFTSHLLEMPSLLDSLNSKALFLDDLVDKEESQIKSSSDAKTLFKLLSSSLQSMPTPPVSPSSSPTIDSSSNALPLPFSIPVSPSLPHQDNSPSPPSMVPSFFPPTSSSGSSFSTSTHVSGHQFSLSPHCRSQDLPSPALIAHSYTPSPQILARPPSSPHSSHPSPPFTPCSLRSLPSPRCLTPSSHKSLISPRSVTPSCDPNQVPNRFMPIQSSGVLPTSLAATHTYIQPIRPVVTLASASSNSTSVGSVSRSLNSGNIGFYSTPQISGSHRNPQGISFELKHHQCIPSPSLLSNSAYQSRAQEVDGLDVIRTSEHKPLEANSTLVLSLSGDIGPFSSHGVGMSWRNTESHQQMDTSRCTSSTMRQSGFREVKDQDSRLNTAAHALHLNSESLPQMQRSDGSNSSLTTSHHSVSLSHKHLNKSTSSSHHPSVFKSQSPYSQHVHAKERDQSSLIKWFSDNQNSNYNQFNDSSRLLSSTAFRPPNTLSTSSLSSHKTVLQTSSSGHPDFLSLPSPKSSPQTTNTNTQTIQMDITNRSMEHHPSSWSTIQTMQHLRSLEMRNLQPTSQDELQVTLDVLKNMDSQYFQ